MPGDAHQVDDGSGTIQVELVLSDATVTSCVALERSNAGKHVLDGNALTEDLATGRGLGADS